MRPLLFVLMALLLPLQAGADYFAKLTWAIPTVRENGTPMPKTDIFGYRIYSDRVSAEGSVTVSGNSTYDYDGTAETVNSRTFSTDDQNLVTFIQDPSVTSYDLRLISSRTCVWMTTLDKFGVESSWSKQVCVQLNAPDSPKITSDPTNASPPLAIRSDAGPPAAGSGPPPPQPGPQDTLITVPLN